MTEPYRDNYFGHGLVVEQSEAEPTDALVTINLDEPGRVGYVRTSGPRLRDALIEAFPLPEKERPRFAKGDRVRIKDDLLGIRLKRGDEGTVISHEDLEYEPSGTVKIALDGGRETQLWGFRVEPALEKPKPEVVPGVVLRSVAWPEYHYTILPNRRYYDHHHRTVFTTPSKETWPLDRYDLVFDPRDAKALPNPLGVRVGDNVRRVQKGDHTTVATEFQVNHIDRQIGYAYPKYGLGHPLDELEVVGREVPGRLPAGTVLRTRGLELLFLRLEDGYRSLSSDGEWPDDLMEREVRKGITEVIYLPES